jgi:hypothetical protein
MNDPAPIHVTNRIELATPAPVIFPGRMQRWRQRWLEGPGDAWTLVRSPPTAERERFSPR